MIPTKKLRTNFLRLFAMSITVSRLIRCSRSVFAAEFASKYLPDHPNMVDVRAQKRDTRSKIIAEVARVIDSLANDVAVGRANVQSLQASLDQLQSKFQTSNAGLS